MNAAPVKVIRRNLHREFLAEVMLFAFPIARPSDDEMFNVELPITEAQTARFEAWFAKHPELTLDRRATRGTVTRSVTEEN